MRWPIYSIKFWIALISVIILVFLPLVSSSYFVRVLTYVFMWITLAESITVIYGYIGRVDFGHVAFFGIGGFTTAILLLHTSIPWPLILILSGICVSVVAFVIGLPTLRLAGSYFAIATWALAEALKQLFVITPITGGSYGLVVPPILTSTQCYWLMILCAVGMILTNFTIERSKIGYAFRSIKGSEIAAWTTGVDVVKYRLIGFMISAFFPGIVGGIYSILIGYVYSYDLFASLKSDQMFIMALLGGAEHFLGPIIGAVLLVVSLEILWTYFTEILYLVFLGAILVLIIMFIPQGIIGLLKERRKEKPKKS